MSVEDNRVVTGVKRKSMSTANPTSTPPRSRLPRVAVIPRAWSTVHTCPYVRFQDTRTVAYVGGGNHVLDYGTVTAGTAFDPVAEEVWYFEVEVVSSGDTGAITVGLVSGDYCPIVQVGVEPVSYGYHHDGHKLSHRGPAGMDGGGNGGGGGLSSLVGVGGGEGVAKNEEYAASFTTGDTVGCLVTPGKKEIAFVKNGVLQPTAFRNVSLLRPLYAALSLHSRGSRVRARFRPPFKFRVEAYVHDLRQAAAAAVAAVSLPPRALPALLLDFMLHYGYRRSYASLLAACVRLGLVDVAWCKGEGAADDDRKCPEGEEEGGLGGGDGANGAVKPGLVAHDHPTPHATWGNGYNAAPATGDEAMGRPGSTTAAAPCSDAPAPGVSSLATNLSLGGGYAALVARVVAASAATAAGMVDVGEGTDAGRRGSAPTPASAGSSGVGGIASPESEGSTSRLAGTPAMPPGIDGGVVVGGGGEDVRTTPRMPRFQGGGMGGGAPPPRHPRTTPTSTPASASTPTTVQPIAMGVGVHQSPALASLSGSGLMTTPYFRPRGRGDSAMSDLSATSPSPALLATSATAPASPSLLSAASSASLLRFSLDAASGAITVVGTHGTPLSLGHAAAILKVREGRLMGTEPVHPAQAGGSGGHPAATRATSLTAAPEPPTAGPSSALLSALGPRRRSLSSNGVGSRPQSRPTSPTVAACAPNATHGDTGSDVCRQEAHPLASPRMAAMETSASPASPSFPPANRGNGGDNGGGGPPNPMHHPFMTAMQAAAGVGTIDPTHLHAFTRSMATGGEGALAPAGSGSWGSQLGSHHHVPPPSPMTPLLSAATAAAASHVAATTTSSTMSGSRVSPLDVGAAAAIPAASSAGGSRDGGASSVSGGDGGSRHGSGGQSSLHDVVVRVGAQGIILGAAHTTDMGERMAGHGGGSVAMEDDDDDEEEDDEEEEEEEEEEGEGEEGGGGYDDDDHDEEAEGGDGDEDEGVPPYTRLEEGEGDTTSSVASEVGMGMGMGVAVGEGGEAYGGSGDEGEEVMDAALDPMGPGAVAATTNTAARTLPLALSALLHSPGAAATPTSTSDAISAATGRSVALTPMERILLSLLQPATLAALPPSPTPTNRTTQHAHMPPLSHRLGRADSDFEGGIAPPSPTLTSVAAAFDVLHQSAAVPGPHGRGQARDEDATASSAFSAHMPPLALGGGHPGSPPAGDGGGGGGSGDGGGGTDMVPGRSAYDALLTSYGYGYTPLPPPTVLTPGGDHHQGTGKAPSAPLQQHRGSLPPSRHAFTDLLTHADVAKCKASTFSLRADLRDAIHAHGYDDAITALTHRMPAVLAYPPHGAMLSCLLHALRVLDLVAVGDTGAAIMVARSEIAPYLSLHRTGDAPHPSAMAAPPATASPPPHTLVPGQDAVPMATAVSQARDMMERHVAYADAGVMARVLPFLHGVMALLTADDPWHSEYAPLLGHATWDAVADAFNAAVLEHAYAQYASHRFAARQRQARGGDAKAQASGGGTGGQGGHGTADGGRGASHVSPPGRVARHVVDGTLADMPSSRPRSPDDVGGGEGAEGIDWDRDAFLFLMQGLGLGLNDVLALGEGGSPSPVMPAGSTAASLPPPPPAAAGMGLSTASTIAPTSRSLPAAHVPLPPITTASAPPSPSATIPSGSGGGGGPLSTFLGRLASLSALIGGVMSPIPGPTAGAGLLSPMTAEGGGRGGFGGRATSGGDGSPTVTEPHWRLLHSLIGPGAGRDDGGEGGGGDARGQDGRPRDTPAVMRARRSRIGAAIASALGLNVMNLVEGTLPGWAAGAGGGVGQADSQARLRERFRRNAEAKQAAQATAVAAAAASSAYNRGGGGDDDITAALRCMCTTHLGPEEVQGWSATKGDSPMDGGVADGGSGRGAYEFAYPPSFFYGPTGTPGTSLEWLISQAVAQHAAEVTRAAGGAATMAHGTSTHGMDMLHLWLTRLDGLVPRP